MQSQVIVRRSGKEIFRGLNYEVYKRRRRVVKPAVSLNRAGYFSFNLSLTESLSNFKYLQLGYDRENNYVVFVFRESAVEDAETWDISKSKKRIYINAQKFLKHFELDLDTVSQACRYFQLYRQYPNGQSIFIAPLNPFVKG